MAGLDAGPAMAEMQNLVLSSEPRAATLLVHQPVKQSSAELCVPSVRAMLGSGKTASPDQAGASYWLIVDRHPVDHCDVAQRPVAAGNPNGARWESGLVKEKIPL